MAIPLDELVNITLLTVAVTVGATALGSLLGVPLGLLLVLERFPGRGAIRTIVYALYAFPPIVAGVLLYLLLRREGPLGDLGLLFTPFAILLGETLLTTPLIAGLTVSALAELPPEVIEIVDSGGPSLPQRAIALLREARFGVTAAVLVGYGRSLAEVAAALILGGNIRGETRTLGTAILLEVNQGDFEFGLACSALILAQALFMAFLPRRLQRAEQAFAHRIDTSHGRPKQPTSEKTGVEGCPVGRPPNGSNMQSAGIRLGPGGGGLGRPSAPSGCGPRLDTRLLPPCPRTDGGGKDDHPPPAARAPTSRRREDPCGREGVVHLESRKPGAHSATNRVRSTTGRASPGARPIQRHAPPAMAGSFRRRRR